MALLSWLWALAVQAANSEATQVMEALMITAEAGLILWAFTSLRVRQGWRIRIVNEEGEELGTYNLSWTESAQCWKVSLTGLQLIKSCASTFGWIKGAVSEWLSIDPTTRTITVMVGAR